MRPFGQQIGSTTTLAAQSAERGDVETKDKWVSREYDRHVFIPVEADDVDEMHTTTNRIV